MMLNNSRMISFFIPIRKNSKRILNKNTKKIGKYNLGLTEIKIKQLQIFRKLIIKDKILKNYNFEFIISSDDKRIEKYAKQFKWIIFHPREKNLALDDSLDKLIQVVPKICKGNLIIWTHVTSPFFNEISYLNFIKNFLKSKKFKSAFTANIISTFLYNFNKKKWISHDKNKKKWPRTQDLDQVFSINSAGFISTKKIYEKFKDRLDNNPLPLSISIQESFDIDNIKEFNLFKKQLKNLTV